MTRGDAREIAEPWAGERQKIIALGLAGDAVHHGKSQDVGQMADGRKGGVVGLG